MMQEVGSKLCKRAKQHAWPGVSCLDVSAASSLVRTSKSGQLSDMSEDLFAFVHMDRAAGAHT